MPTYIKRLPSVNVSKTQSPAQRELFVDLEGEVDGIGMGVLSDGTPFLNQRGLATICGVQNAHIGTISSGWADDAKPRIAQIKKILAQRGLEVSCPHIELYYNGRKNFAYPDYVCMAILEYYAFDAGNNVQDEAKQRYRWLAGRSLREVIYQQLGYKKESALAETWRQFHDRVLLVDNNVPNGYFCVFKEIADLMVALINVDAPLGSDFLPDISVGRKWSEYWASENLGEAYGGRVQYEHHFPDYFPQSKSNPQYPYCYPEGALGVFRKWMREHYIKTGLKLYLDGKVKKGELPTSTTQHVIQALSSRGSGNKIIKA